MVMKTQKQNSLHVAFFGASPDTGNQGVNALNESTLSALNQRGVSEASVFGFTPENAFQRRDGESQMTVERFAAFRTRRFYRPESLFALRQASKLGGLWHRGSRAFLRSDAILDISAGDSFSDLYGWDRFCSVMEPKMIALETGRPLILLPQTIGPFESPRARQLARHVLQDACQVWARDEESFTELRTILGEAFDPARFRQGVDMAFLLRPQRPDGLPAHLDQWLQRSEAEEVIGLNVSGLIYNSPQDSAKQFGLRADYREVVHRFLDWILRNANARLLIIPHVLTDTAARESDYAAALQVRGQLGDNSKRVEILSPNYSASELKWIIGKTAWFCGTRMHSTIAALSSGVPAASLSYSMKTRGVFASCRLEDSVFEMRHLKTQDLVDNLIASWKNRQLSRKRLAAELPRVVAQANLQMNEIVECVGQGMRERGRGPNRGEQMGMKGGRARVGLLSNIFGLGRRGGDVS